MSAFPNPPTIAASTFTPLPGLPNYVPTSIQLSTPPPIFDASPSAPPDDNDGENIIPSWLAGTHTTGSSPPPAYTPPSPHQHTDPHPSPAPPALPPSKDNDDLFDDGDISISDDEDGVTKSNAGLVGTAAPSVPDGLFGPPASTKPEYQISSPQPIATAWTPTPAAQPQPFVPYYERKRARGFQCAKLTNDQKVKLSFCFITLSLLACAGVFGWQAGVRFSSFLPLQSASTASSLILRSACRTNTTWRARCIQVDPAVCSDVDSLAFGRQYLGADTSTYEVAKWTIGQCGEWLGVSHSLMREVRSCYKKSDGSTSCETNTYTVWSTPYPSLIPMCHNYATDYNAWDNGPIKQACVKAVSENLGPAVGWTVGAVLAALFGFVSLGVGCGVLFGCCGRR
ncbi:hypothetical protein M427DRAFT_430561 [Gonapodya prolifera JEL478]|uniref:Uncharacterized protein n=1 Tax=Gonapodya prolifera (strain JEL478) TaxID=1344416 RepID=A0A139ASW2_GONPJ|nr:hypothetical protein M427DRAFT_430561 [Gonapodya prolifera JEL478]|eukprot:KXS19818.1 hypothetical protein M427DRAFT_430561 [Gonapodya prolifera JEL478]